MLTISMRMVIMKPMRVLAAVMGAVLSFGLGDTHLVLWPGSISDYAYAEERTRLKSSDGLSQAGAKSLFARVLVEFDKGNYEGALAGFQFFLALYPKSQLASYAQFWAGDCEYQLGRYKNAIASLSRVITQYHNSPKKAAATLKMGMAYGQLGQQDVSRIILERVLVEFPNTPEEQLASKTLAQLLQTHQSKEMLSQTGEDQNQKASH
jgi:tol-pal system protein YbgF